MASSFVCLLAGFCLVSVAVSQPDPDRCCFPVKSHYIAEAVTVSIANSQQFLTTSTTVTDYDAVKGISSTMTFSFTGSTQQKTHQIVDYKNGVMYIVDMNRNTCTKAPVPSKIQYCIPQTAKHMRSGKLGANEEKMSYNTWSIPMSLGPVVETTEATVSAERCIPLAATTFSTKGPSQFFSIASIVNTTEVPDESTFKIPDICNKSHSAGRLSRSASAPRFGIFGF